MDFPQTLQVDEIAQIIDARIKGNPKATAIGLNELHVVRSGDITFFC